ncbi:hypothetical protein bcere0002_58440 [Bacillus cereus ATCC 10876]|nr:hypothetical protein bcere0002_58440 [Bacillus cereus ATCC 10876]
MIILPHVTVGTSLKIQFSSIKNINYSLWMGEKAFLSNFIQKIHVHPR